MSTIDEARAKAEAKQTLLKQAHQLDLKVDSRWSVETLAEKVVEAQYSLKERQTQAIMEASDTWVYLLKGAYPVEDEKHFAGETIKVPAEIADKWYEAGVARPGKAPA